MRRRPLVGLLLGTVTLVVAVFLFVLPGRAYLGQRRSLNAAELRSRVLSAENAKLDRQIQQLQTDAEIERLARQQYGLVKPGEQAFAILPPKQAPAPPAPPAPPKKLPHHAWWEIWAS